MASLEAGAAMEKLVSSVVAAVLVPLRMLAAVSLPPTKSLRALARLARDALIAMLAS